MRDWKYASPNQWSTFHRFKWETWRQRNTGNRLLVADEGSQVAMYDPLVSTRPQRSPVLGIFGLNRQGGIPVFVAGFDHRSQSEKRVPQPDPLRPDTGQAPHLGRALLFADPLFSSCTRPGSKADWNSGFFYDVLSSEENLQVGQLSGDFRGTVLALKLTNPTTYLGYKLITEVGMSYNRRSLERRSAANASRRASGLFFVSFLAGLR